MKKVLNLVFIVTCIFVLSSCGFKKEIEAPEIDGDRMSKSKVESFYKEFEGFYEKIEKGDKNAVISKGWYSVSGNLLFDINQKDGEEWKNITIKAKISGDMYDSSYVYDQKMHLTIRLEIIADGNEDEDAQHIKGKYEMFVKDGMSWVNGNFSTDNEDKKEKMQVYLKGSFDELMDQIPSEIKGMLNMTTSTISSMQLVGCSFMEELEDYNEETTSVYEKDDKYTIKKDEKENVSANIGEISTKSIIEVEFKDKENYVAKEYNVYGDIGIENKVSNASSNINISYEISVKKKVMGIIIPPIFEGKYQNYGDSKLFPDL